MSEPKVEDGQVTDAEADETARDILDDEAEGAQVGVTTAEEVDREPADEQDLGTGGPDHGGDNNDDDAVIDTDVDLAGQLRAAIIEQDTEAQQAREEAAELDGLAAEKVRSDAQKGAADATLERARQNAAAKLQAKM